MKTWVLLMWLLHFHMTQHGADSKRFDPSMVDPLTRRSPLDKNFMRFGRSSPSYTEEDDVEDSSPGGETNKEDNFLRSMRGKDNFLRFGKARNDNFMRFGKGGPDNYMRFGRSPNDNFMRFGKGKQDSYMRFGRGKQDSYMRFGRGKQDSYMRFGRGKQDSYMRFGRGKQDSYMRFGRGKDDNFMRFGRGKQDSYMRFGRNFEDVPNTIPDIFGNVALQDPDILRDSRGRQDSFMRFGKNVGDESEDDIPISMRSGGPKSSSNFMRFGRAKQNNFMRFGKSANDKYSLDDDSDETKEESIKDNSNYPNTLSDSFNRETKSKDMNLIRYGRHTPNKNDGFIRFGRSDHEQPDDSSQDNDLIPQRLKRSLSKPFDSQDEVYSAKIPDDIGDHVMIPFSSSPEGFEEAYASPVNQDDYTTRRKRSLAFASSTPTPFSESDTSVDFISAKLRFDTPPVPDYRSSLFSAGLPNVIVGPEFSLLPDLNPPPAMLKRGRAGDQNFLRLG